MSDIELDFGAITIDTNILKQWGFQFDTGILNQMSQFLHEPVRVIQTDIVHQETKKHIADEVNKARIAVRKGLRLASNQLGIDKNNVQTATQLLSATGEDREVAEERLNKYYNRIGAEILKTDDYIDCKKLMKMYFETRAPFEKKETKKNEFPDAIALISLEQWAEKNDIKILAVSADKGWENFAKNSKRITVLNDLAKAIEELQPETKVKRIITIIYEKEILVKENHISDEITQKIIESVENSDVYVDAGAAYRYEQTDSYITYINHTFALNQDGLVDINVVMVKDNIITFQVM
ncbi:MAG: PIN domain-containing protein [Negativicutes bacterium]